MQPFHMTGRQTRRNRTSTTGAGLGYADSLKNSPSFNALIRELGVILLACLGLAAAAEFLVRTLGTH